MAHGQTRTAWIVVAMAGLVAISAGCNPLFPFFMAPYLMGADQKANIKFHFPDNARRIAVLTYVPRNIQSEWGAVDREINEMVSRKIHEYIDSQNRKYKAKVVMAKRVHDWLDKHPDWHSMPLGEIAAALNVDHLVYLDFHVMSFYPEGSYKNLYQGHAEASISVIRQEDGHADTVFPAESFVIDYPRTAPIHVQDMPLARFRREYLKQVAERVSWFFVPHETRDEF